jgi:hypothetical protein
MGAISFSLDEKLLAFLTRQLSSEVFVETGTFKGETLRMASKYFKECHSVEMSPQLFADVQKAFEREKGVHLFNGPSPDFFRKYKFPEKAVVYWLDAHWCGADHTAGEESQSPILEELELLAPLGDKSVVLIDDARLYLSPPLPPHRVSQWPDFHSIVTALLRLSSQHRLLVLNDVIIFYPKAMQAAMLQYAHDHGVDWLKVSHDAKKLEQRELRKFPFFKYLRHLWRQRQPTP